MNRGRRILIGPVEIAGYYSNLYDGLKKIGVNVDFYTYKQHPFAYGHNGTDTRIRTAIQRLVLLLASRRSYWIRTVAAAALVPLLVVHAAHAALRYDAFIFSFGQSLLPRNLDLPLWRLLGKRVVCVIAHGSEARPPYMSALHRHQAEDPMGLRLLKRRTRRTSGRVRRIHRWAGVVVGAPFSSSYFAPGRQVNHFVLGLPQPSLVQYNRMGEWTTHVRSPNSVNVLHAPSRPSVKGTVHIRSAVQALQDQGLQINFTELQNASNDEVLAALQAADFVIDQVFTDTPMAGFAAEAARYGVPAIVGGYGLDELTKHIPEAMIPPSLVCHPDLLRNAITDLTRHAGRRVALGVAAQQFVTTQWSSVTVAKKYLQLLDGDFPQEWTFDPNDIEYLHGSGQSEENVKELIRTYVKRFGKRSLRLSHRPKLEADVLRFAAADDDVP